MSQGSIPLLSDLSTYALVRSHKYQSVIRLNKQLF